MKKTGVHKTVDAVIPTYFPGDKLDRLLEILSRQSYPLNKIILINTVEEGLRQERIASYKNIALRHIKKEEFDHGGSRNLGVSLSHADYFLCMTDDAVPGDEYLVERLVEGMESNERIAAVYGRQLPTEESGFDERFSRGFNYPEGSFNKGIEDLQSRGIKAFFQSNVCCLYRRDVFDSLGGFIEHTIFNEDMLYCAGMLRAGYLSRYEASATVYHAHNYSGMQQLHRNFDLGVSQAEHPEVFSGIRSEGEGIRLVLDNASELIRTGRIYLLPALFYRYALRYIGFRLGRMHSRLPRSLVTALSMNKSYWRRK